MPKDENSNLQIIQSIFTLNVGDASQLTLRDKGEDSDGLRCVGLFSPFLVFQAS